MTLQQVEHHAVAGGELTHQRIGRARGQLSRLTHPLKSTLNGHHITLRV